MNIKESTGKYEGWLRDQLRDFPEFDASAFEAALASKHADMKEKEGEHAFLRGTFYRWAQQWASLSDKGVIIPVVGDTHVENFGTWRDAEGRLVWGVNDFDEACELPWTSDLVRLGVSARLVLPSLGNFGLSADDVCDVIYEGYAGVVGAREQSAFVLQEDNEALRKFAWKLVAGESPKEWWKKQPEKLSLKDPPKDAREALRSALPGDATEVEYFERKKDSPAGMGSRGKPRYYALAIWKGARILREAKAIVPSALQWVSGADSGKGLKEMLELSVRCPDPFHTIHGQWAVRRLAPDSEKIDLKKLDKAGANADQKRELFTSMGAELANLHCGTAKEDLHVLQSEVERRDTVWFRKEVKEWTNGVQDDFKDF